MEDLALLKKISFFKDLEPAELLKINMISHRAAFKAGEEIVREGTPCDAFYIVKKGSVKVLKGRKHIITIGEREPVGELSFIDKGMRSATVVALEDAVLIKLPSDAFDKVLFKNKGIASKIYKAIAILLCRRLREANEALKLLKD